MSKRLLVELRSCYEEKLNSIFNRINIIIIMVIKVGFSHVCLGRLSLSF